MKKRKTDVLSIGEVAGTKDGSLEDLLFGADYHHKIIEKILRVLDSHEILIESLRQCVRVLRTIADDQDTKELVKHLDHLIKEKSIH